MPRKHERQFIFPDVTATVGGTPLVELGRLAKGLPGRVVAKLEMRNPCGSVKDRVGVALIESAERQGVLRPGMTLVEATGGNTGIGLAFAAATRSFWIYLAGAALVAAGYADFSLIAYHFEKARSIPNTWVPIFYAVAMGVSGLGSLVLGRVFDRIGLKVLAPLTLAASVATPLVFWGGFPAALVGIALWGLGMGVHESIMAAAVAEMVPANRLATAYGIFTTGYGVSWFVGSAALGFLYDRSIPALVAFSILVELSAIPFFIALRLGPSHPAAH